MSKRFTQEQKEKAIETVLAGLRMGTPLTVLCNAPDMPCDDTIRIWAAEDEDIARAIARARDIGFDVIATDAMNIIDAEPERVITVQGDDKTESRIDSASVQHAYRRAELRLKLLAKWDPKRYGEKILHGSDPENPLPAGFDVKLHGNKKAG